jgi:hypothetical protein
LGRVQDFEVESAVIKNNIPISEDGLQGFVSRIERTLNGVQLGVVAIGETHTAKD